MPLDNDVFFLITYFNFSVLIGVESASREKKKKDYKNGTKESTAYLEVRPLSLVAQLALANKEKK